ncbi:MAG TPA: SCO family protein [Stellaceae bacterium]|nr:SCO family protein [Stellaceae bacterium]
MKAAPHRESGQVKSAKRLLPVISLAALVVAGSILTLVLVAVRDTHPPAATSSTAGAAIGGPFTLVDGDGKTVTDQRYRGKLLLIYFGYTFCPDVCPTTLNNIAQALVALGPQADSVVPLFITVDPRRDTPSVIGHYVKSFDPRIVGLTGSDAQIAAVAKEYHVYYAAQPAQHGDYLVDHSSLVYLMDRNGKFLKVFAGSLSGGEMADAIRPFLAPGS